MRATSSQEEDNGLPPPGQRWGAGAQSVLPYLSRTLRSRPTEAPQTAREPKPGERPTEAMNWKAGRS
jgi:hypothetical protein